jgi:hypothetical protein
MHTPADREIPQEFTKPRNYIAKVMPATTADYVSNGRSIAAKRPFGGRIFCGKPVSTFPENAPSRALMTANYSMRTMFRQCARWLSVYSRSANIAL